MKFSYFLPVLPALITAAPMPDSAAADAVIPPAFRVYGTTYGGTGCPQGSLDDTSIFTNATVLALVSAPSDFVAQNGPNVPITEERTFCQLNFDILYSPGYQFRVYTSNVHGHAKLAGGTTATVQSTYYFSGSTDEVR